MTTRAQLRINTVAQDGTKKNQVNIGLADGTVTNYSKYSAFQNETAGTAAVLNADLNTVRGKDGNNNRNVTSASTLRTVNIVCADEKEAIKVLNLLNLKNKIKEAGTVGPGASWQITIDHIIYDHNATYNTSDRTTFLEINNGTDSDSTGNNVLTLRTSDFGGITNLNIDNNTWAKDAVYTKVDDFSTQKLRLIALEDKINEVENYYLTNKVLRDEGNKTVATTNRGFLNVFVVAAQGTTPNVATDIDYTLYQDFLVNTNQVYEDKINRILNFFDEADVWRSNEIGFTNIEEILRANANGFRISERGTGNTHITISDGTNKGNLNPDGTNGPINIAAVKVALKDGKYKGFKIVDSTQKILEITATTDWNTAGVTAPVANERWVQIGGFAAVPSQKISKTNIDFFRHDDNFPETEVANDKVADPRNCRGFAPGDIAGTVGNYYGHGMGLHKETDGSYTFKRETKIIIDIWGAPTLEEAIDLAFFGRDYDSAPAKTGGRLTQVNPDLLFFNERTDKNEIEMLEEYYWALQDVRAGQNLATGLTSWNTTGYVQTTPSGGKEKIDKAYTLAKAFLVLYLDAKSKSGTKEAEAVKTQLQAYKASGTPTVGSDEDMKNKLFSHWENEINAITTGPIQQTLEQKIDAAKAADTDEGSAERNAVYDSGKVTLDNFEKVKELLGLIKKAYKGDDKDNTRTELLNYKNANKTSNDKDEKTRAEVWEFVGKCKDKDGNEFGVEALNKVAEDQQSELATAQSALKAEIDNIPNIGTRKDEVYNLIKDKLGSDATAVHFNDAASLLKLIKSVKDKTTDDAARSNLNNYKSGNADKQKVWAAVNEYKPDGTKGYAQAAYDKLDKATQVAKHFAIRIGYKPEDIKDKASLEAIKVKAKKEPDYDKVQTAFEKSFSIMEIVVEFEKSDAKPEERELVKLLRPYAPVDKVNVSDHYADSSEPGLKELERVKTELEKYKSENGKEGAVYKSLDASKKEVINKLISEIDKKITSMRSAQQKGDDNSKNQNPTDDKPLWKNPIFITIMVVGGLAAVLATVVYFMKKSDESSEEEL